MITGSFRRFFPFQCILEDSIPSKVTPIGWGLLFAVGVLVAQPSLALAAPLANGEAVEKAPDPQEPFLPPVESVNNHPFKQQKTLRAYLDALTAESEDAQAHGDEAVESNEDDSQND